MRQLWILVAIVLFNFQDSFGSFRPAAIKSSKIVPPVKFEDCFAQLDTILNESFLLEVKNLPIDIATIKLDYEIGSYLLDKWKLNYSGIKGIPYFRKDRIEFVQLFFDEKINEPYVVLRIVFRCYHNHLNNLPINFISESRYYKNIPDIISLEVKNYPEMCQIRNIVTDYEDALIKNFQLSFFSLGDTVGFSDYLQRSRVKCLFTGILVGLDTLKNIGKIYIFDIACSNRNTTFSTESIQIKLFDTIAMDLKNCYNLNYKYPTYVYGDPFMWNRYMDLKYTK